MPSPSRPHSIAGLFALLLLALSGCGDSNSSPSANGSSERLVAVPSSAYRGDKAVANQEPDEAP